MVKKALRIVLFTIFTISLLFVVPFNNINADTFEWYRVTGELMSSQLNNELTINNTKVFEYLFNYQYHVKFDDSYLGYAQISITQEYYDDTDNNGAISVNTLKTYTTPLKTYYVNSDEVVVNLSLKVRISSAHIQTNYDPCKNFTPSVTVSNANVNKIGLLTSIDEVIDILSNIYSSVDDIEALSTNQLTELENIVSNTSLANQYLDQISKFRLWNIPIESVSFISSLLIYREPFDIYDNGYYSKYPLFYVNKNITNVAKFRVNNRTKYTFIMYSNVSTASKFSTLYNFDIPYTISNYTTLNNTIIKYNNFNLGFNLIKFDITFSSNGDATLMWNTTDGQFDILMPIYFGYSNHISTEFALQYGLTNQLLDDIHLIADGTNASSAASSQSDQANQQLQTDSNTLFSQEDSFKQNMNSAMQNIDTTFSLNNFGSSFMTSAQWVRTQYETLTNNTPFASLITFSLLVGLALIVIGKVYK